MFIVLNLLCAFWLNKREQNNQKTNKKKKQNKKQLSVFDVRDIHYTTTERSILIGPKGLINFSCYTNSIRTASIFKCISLE